MRLRTGIATCTVLVLLCSPACAVSLAPGDIQPDFTLNKFNTNQQVNCYNDLAGKILIFDFFTYTCGHCAAAAAQLEPNIQQYYAARGGNPSHIPVLLVSVNCLADAVAGTQSFINNYGLGFVLDDPLRTLFNQYSTGLYPRFAIVNGATGTNRRQWEVVFTQTRLDSAGYMPFRTAIDSIVTVGQSRIWLGTANEFLGSSANWQGETAPSSLDVLVFGPPGNGHTNPINGGAALLSAVGGITFDATDYTLSGTSALTVSGTIANNATVATLDMPITLTGPGGVIDGGAAAGNMLTIVKPVSGSVGLTKTGEGAVALTAEAAYSGNTTVAAGTLILHSLSNDDSTTVSGTLAADFIRQDALTINASGKVTIIGAGTSVVNFLNIADTSGAFSWGTAGSGTSGSQNVVAVPEPATWLLAVLAALAAFATWRRRK